MVKRKVNTRDNIASAFDPAVERARLQELDDTEVKRSRNDLFAFTRMMKQEVMDKGSTPSAFEPAEKRLRVMNSMTLMSEVKISRVESGFSVSGSI